MMTRLTLLHSLLVALVAVLFLAVPGRAAGPVDIPANLTVIDLASAATPVVASRQNIAIEVPGNIEGTRNVLALRGAGSGPTYNWTVFTLRNSTPQLRKLVLLVEEQRFVGSGLTELKSFGLRARRPVFSSGQQAVEQEPVHGGMAFSFPIEPNATLTFALEGPSTITTVKLYSQLAFASREYALSFLRGAVLVLTILIALANLALFGFRRHAAFVAGSFFAVAALGFMALDSGYLGALIVRHLPRVVSPDLLRALVENTFLLALTVCVLVFAAIGQRGKLAVLGGLLLIAACLASFAYSFYAPLSGTTATRAAIAGVTALAFAVAYLIRNSRLGAVKNAIIFWSALALWVFLAAVVALETEPTLTHQVSLLGGLAAVLVVMTWTLARFAAQGFVAKPVVADASRKSLALSGAKHFVWDWRPLENKIDIGADLATHLSYKTKEWEAASGEAFLSILHPDDEPSYRTLMDVRALEPNSFHELELRLRDANNIYRWFALRVQALPGAGNKLARCIGTLTDVTRHKVAEDRLMNDAVRDPVTGLPSRAIFADRLASEIAKPIAMPVQVLLVGLERFKSLNDGLGHEIGDQLLLIAGRRIQECLAPAESVARLSGSQFAVMFVEAIDTRGHKILAEQIKRALSEPITLGGQEIYLSPSVGISLSSADGYSAEQLLDQAAMAQQQAQKQTPRQAIRQYQPSDESERESHVALESDLRRAIERNEIEVLYQPIIDLEQRTVAGLEALARWRHPQDGLLQPSRFLNLAEQAGVMPEITMIVLAEAARQMGIWQRTVTRNRPIYVAVNIPADQLTDTGFVERLRGLVNREGLRPDALKIEITESVAMRHLDRARQFIKRLKALGVGVACDDFGTGFSSLASLRDLPFDTLKIDRTFLLPEALEGRGGVILDTVVGLAHNLGMTVVAEGIESEAQAERLRNLGCDLGQGFHFAEPLDASEIKELLSILPRTEEPVADETAFETDELEPDPSAEEEIFEGEDGTDVEDEEFFDDDEEAYEDENLEADEPPLAVTAEHIKPRAPAPRPPAQAPQASLAPRRDWTDEQFTRSKPAPPPADIPLSLPIKRQAAAPVRSEAQDVSASQLRAMEAVTSKQRSRTNKKPSILGDQGSLAAEIRAVAKPEGALTRRRKRPARRPAYKEIY